MLQSVGSHRDGHDLTTEQQHHHNNNNYYYCVDVGSSPGLGISLGVGNCKPLQSSCLENAVDQGVWPATGHRVTKSRTGLSD